MKKPSLLFLATISFICTQAQWWPELRITFDPYNSYSSIRRSICASNDTAHVVWYDESMENPTVHYARSLDAGLNWDTEVRLTSGEYFDEKPSIAVQGNYVHVVWFNYIDWTSDDNEIYYMRSTNGGADWESALQLTSYGGIKWYPAIAVSANYVHVIWYDICKEQGEDQWEIYYLRSADYGATWEEPVRLTFDPERSVFCTLAAEGPVLHLVWHDWRHGEPEVYYKRSGDNGTTWGEEIRMTDYYGESRFPEIAASGSFVQIVFQDNREGNFDIYYFTSMDSGLTWGPETRLTYGYGSKEHPYIAINGSESHVVWQDMRVGWYQAYYKLGHDYGTRWDDDESLVNTYYNTTYPSVSFSGEWLHVAWQDERDGNAEIYCKNKYIESTIGIEEPSTYGESFYVYPVPAGIQLTVGQLDDKLSIFDFRFSIFDLIGREVKDIGEINAFPHEIDISDLPDGVYILKMTGDSGNTGAVKFVKAADGH